MSNGSPATMSGTLLDGGKVAPSPAGQAVMFTLGSGAGAQSCSGIVSAGGHAQCTIASVRQPDSATFTIAAKAQFAGDVYYLPSESATASVALLYYSGRAIGSSVRPLNLFTIALPDTGAIQTAQAVNVQRTAASAAPSSLGSASKVTAAVVTGGGIVTATSTATSLSLSGGSIPKVQANSIAATTRSTCTGVTGSSSFSSLKINGASVNVSKLAANTTIKLPLGGSIVLNQQIAAPDHGLTVNALHISIPGIVDVVQASVTSAIHNCP